MPPEAGYMIFVAVMTALSIPIIAIIRSKPKGKDYQKKIDNIMQRLEKLENEKFDNDREIEKLYKEVSFLSKLIEYKEK